MAKKPVVLNADGVKRGRGRPPKQTTVTVVKAKAGPGRPIKKVKPSKKAKTEHDESD